MRCLVVYYSRDGSTKKVGESIAAELKCDIEEIVDMRNRGGVLGFITAGMDASRRRLTRIKETTKDPAAYDLVVVGTPIWGSNMTPAIRTYLSQNKDKLRNVAFYCTCGGSGGKALVEMEKLCGKKPSATLELATEEVVKGEISEKVKRFSESIKQVN